MATILLRDSKLKLILLLGLVLMGETAMSYEEPKYTVVYADAGIEYRQYDSHLVSETIIQNAVDSDAAGNEGFRRLFRYITGANKAQSKISMTVPVSQSSRSGKRLDTKGVFSIWAGRMPTCRMARRIS